MRWEEVDARNHRRIDASGGKPEFTGLTLRDVTSPVTLDVSPDGTRVVFAGQLRTTVIEPATRRGR